MLSPAKKAVEPPEPVRTFLPDTPASSVTLGALFSESATGGYLDSITGLWSPANRDAFLFLNSRFHIEDNGQTINTMGLGFRKLVPDHEIIIGGNIYWDRIHSDRANDFNQLGLGLEVLTHWVDARFNYYIPENDCYEVDRSTHRRSRNESNAFETVERTETLTFKRFEAALEGFNAEVGFLVPGLDKYVETRVYGGYYHYDNPFGGDFEGFNARLEARLLRGVIAGVEYWQDDELMGGNWTAGISVNLPFSLFELAKGRNPFAGAADSFRPGPRDFAARMGDQVERSHRIQTVTSDPILTSRRVTESRGGESTTVVFPSGGGGFPVE